MTFLQPLLLFALPLIALPVIIHLIHLYRRRQVKWAAMMFLKMAQRMNKGLSRLRQVLILAFRVLTLAGILLVIARPLSGGWLGLTGGAPDTVMILLDRSASMEQKNPATGVSKRAAGLANLAKAIKDAVGTRSRLVLVDSATLQPLAIDKADALLDLPQTEATETAADIPGLLQSALDFITTNKTGRTDVWLVSDLQQSDWDASGGRWETLRSAYATLQGVRFHLLCYPEAAQDDVAVTIERVVRRETNEKAELLFDLRLTRHVDHPEPMEVPLRFVVNGTATTAKVELKDNQLAQQAYALPIDKSSKRGWGRVELPSDASGGNNVFHFVYDDAPVLQSVIVSDDEAESGPLSAALSAATDPTRKYTATVLPTARAAEIPWDDAALILWHAPLPKPDDALARQLQSHVAAGRAVIFLPTETPDDTKIFGLGWERWEKATSGKPQTVEWWRNDTGLLANTRDGAALPVGTLEVERRCGIVGEGIPLARMAGQGALLMRSSLERSGGAYFLGTLPSPAGSSLARDGVVMFALLHRALNEGAATLGKAQQRLVSAAALGGETSRWKPMELKEGAPTSLALRAGVVEAGEQMVALNRPPGEDAPEVLAQTGLKELFAGLDFRVLTDDLKEGRSLTNEVWRTFLIIAALALVGEALLCMPARREVLPEKKNSAPARPVEATV